LRDFTDEDSDDTVESVGRRKTKAQSKQTRTPRQEYFGEDSVYSSEEETRPIRQKKPAAVPTGPKVSGAKASAAKKVPRHVPQIAKKSAAAGGRIVFASGKEVVAANKAANQKAAAAAKKKTNSKPEVRRLSMEEFRQLKDKGKKGKKSRQPSGLSREKLDCRFHRRHLRSS